MSTYQELHRRHGARHKWLATGTVMMGTFSVVLAATILNVALPQIMAVYAVGQQTVQWLITGFLAAMTTGMLLNAWCVERFGMRGTYVGWLVVFCAASVLGAVAPSIGWLILARVAQGLSAGVVQPLGMLVIYEVFDPRERGKGYGMYGLGVVLGPAIAPMIGGLLVDFLSWRAAFLIAIPSCIAAALMALSYLRGRNGDGPKPALDVAGLALLAGTLAVGLWALASGPRVGWHQTPVLLGLAAATAGAVAFVVWQRVCATPLLDLTAFAAPGFGGGFLMAMMIGVGLYGSTYLIPLYIQQVRGMDASAAGLLLLPGGLAMAVTFPLAGPLSDRMAPAALGLIGLLIFLASSLMLARVDAATGVPWLLAGILAGRVGLGVMMPPITGGALRLLEPRLVPQGSGAVNFGRQLGGALGVSLMAVVLDVGSGAHGAGFAALDAAGRLAAQVRGYDLAFLVLAAVFAASVVPLWWMHRARPRG